MKKYKISIVTFNYLSEKAAGPVEEALSIANILYDHGFLHKVFCLGYKNIEYFPEEIFVTPPFPSFYRVLDNFLSVASKIHRRSFRFLKEKIFDFFLSKDKTILNSDCVLFLKPPFPVTSERLKNKGIKVIAWSSIFHPRFNYKQVKKEEQKYGLEWHSNYTNYKRVQYLSNFYQNIDILFVQSLLAYNIYREYGVPEDKIVRLKNTFGVNCERYRPTQKAINRKNFRVLHISHMNLIKGLGYLLQAWKNLGLVEAELLLGGKVDENIITLLDRIKSPSICLLGNLNNPVPTYQNADLFISPSVSDVHPYTILEAMACGIPVVSSNMCGAAEVINHGVDGFIYRYDSVMELQNLLRYCSENKQQLSEMGKKAREKALVYERGNFGKKIADQIYKRLPR